ncbi:MAG TPA: molybdate ABC transporter substrate-binding protein [Dongiaceae bacterium]|jgi:molybdate transport system substrate-binding protein|nr:molybdate ABC transporter substrate-binding protein [Dongiaceae bacterium]
MPARIACAFLPVFLLTALACSRESSITVSAATSLTDVVGEAARVYSDSTGIDVVTRFGASGVMARAIEEGTSADIFISADAEWVEELGKRGLIESATARILAWNRLVFVIPAMDSGRAVATPPALVNLKSIAIGDPETVPAGHYARQALTKLSLWPFLETKLVKATDVRAVLNLVETEQVEGGVVYATDAQTTTKVRVAFTFPEGSHDPVAYPGAVLTGSRHGKAALSFLEFLSSPKGRAIFQSYGFQES